MNDDRRTAILDIVEPHARLSTISQVTTGAQQASQDDQEVIEHGRCRISRKPQMMLGFRKCSGEIDVLPYATLTRIRSEDTSRSMRLCFSQGEVLIEGEELTQLFHYVCEHRVLEIAESDRTDCLSSRSAMHVSTIKMQFSE